MLVVFDTTFLVPLLDPSIAGKAIEPKIEFLIRSLEKQKAKIIVPTPALSELLIGAGDAAPKYLEIINKSSRFKVAPFGERAAVEAAAAHRLAKANGDKKEGLGSWAKVKYDRQIVSIAKVEGASVIYSNDTDIEKLCENDSMEVINLSQLTLPPEEAQTSLKLD